MEVEEGTELPEDSPETKYIVSSKKKTCQRLPKKIKKSLESTIHWTIMSILHEIIEDYSEIEKHLFILKERLLKYIATVEVPVRELNYLSSVKKVLKEESEKYILMEEYVLHLEEEISKDVLTLCGEEEKEETLQKENEPLRRELATIKAEADKLFYTDTNHYLGLPGLSVEYYKRPPLQNEILKIGNPQALLDDMNIIQQSDEMKNMMLFLEQLYEKAERQIKEQ